MSWPADCASGPCWPHPVMRPYTRRRFASRHSSGPSPSLSMTPGLNPSISRSASATRRSSAAAAAGFFRSIARDLFPRCTIDHLAASPDRWSKPVKDAVLRSMRITSAPISDSSMPQNGTGPIPPTSMTFIPESGPMDTAICGLANSQCSSLREGSSALAKPLCQVPVTPLAHPYPGMFNFRLATGKQVLQASGKNFRTIWLKSDDPTVVQIIDQRLLPHEFAVQDLRTWEDAAYAISEMLVRGAPLIGATAAWGLYLAALAGRQAANPGKLLGDAAEGLGRTRPTAVNLRWAIDRVMARVRRSAGSGSLEGLLREEAQAICEEDIEISRGIGEHGVRLIEDIAQRKNGGTVNVLTHCNAGSLATINWGTATAPIYFARQKGIDVHVWVDETRPRNQGSQLTAWELAQNGVAHTLVVDNAGGHLMQRGKVDLCITGTDRTTRTGDVANKIGTYLKALAAADNGIPFYVALPSTTIDWTIAD